MKLLVSIDVEGKSPPEKYECVDILDGFLDEFDFSITLFVTPDVVKNRPETVSQWLESGHAIGLHIHPGRMTGESDWLTSYDEQEIEDLLIRGCEVFENQIDYRPRLFRAGRWEYSEALHSALGNQGFYRDASLRPDKHQTPYKCYGVEEVPMSVYDNPLVRLALTPWTISSLPFHADGLLSKLFFIPGFYFVTWRVLLSNRPYLMVSLHDYDVQPPTLRTRLRSYINHLANYTSPKTIDAIEVELGE